MSRARRIAVAGIFAVPVVLAAMFVLLSEERWSGYTNLELIFAIHASKNGRPVEGATLRVVPEAPSICCGEPDVEFTLRTDADGQYRWFCPRCRCGGERSLLKDSFGVFLPMWHFRVEAPGFTSSDWLYTTDYSPKVRRIGSGRSRLVIRVEIEPSASRLVR